MTQDCASPARSPSLSRGFALGTSRPSLKQLIGQNTLLVGVLMAGLLASGVGWSLFSARLGARAYHAEESAQEVTRIWGGPLLQPQPEVRWRRADAATVELALADLSKTHVKATLDASYRRRGITEYPAYEVALQGDYTFVNPSTEPAFVAFSVGLPVDRDALMLRDLSLWVDGKEDAAHTEYTPDRILWTGSVSGAHTTRFTVAYRARGLERFGYTLATRRPSPEQESGVRSQRPVTAFELELVVRGARGTLDYPVGAMSPTLDEPTEGGRRLVWQVDRLLTAFDVGVVLPDARGVEVSLKKLTTNAFWFEALYAVGLVFALAGISSRARALHALGLLGAYFLFFPLTTYLAAYLPWVWALGLSTTATTALVVSHVARFVGGRATVWVALNQLFFQAAPAVAYLVPGPGGASGTHTGLVLVLAGFGALAVALQLLGQLSFWLREKEEGPGGVDQVAPLAESRS